MVFQTMSQLFHGCVPDHYCCPHFDASDRCPYFRFRLERKNTWHFSDHVVCRVDVSSLRFDVFTFSQDLTELVKLGGSSSVGCIL